MSKSVYDNFMYSGGKYITITRVKETYSTTKSGAFRRKPDTIERETITPEFYQNFVRSISFFNGFFGGTCRASWAYTCAGYIPVRVVTVSPGRDTKQVDCFVFESIVR